MKRIYLLLLFAVVAVFGSQAQNKSAADLRINEFMASNATVIADEFGEYNDWIEIFNGGSDTVDLAGMYITDSYNKLTKWKFISGYPETKIPPMGFVIVWADDDSTTQGALHTNFKLSASGEKIALVMPDGFTIVDSVKYVLQATDISYGRVTDGTGLWSVMPNPTPGYSNAMASVSENDDVNFMVYPNPVADRLYFSTDATTVDALMITDLSGRIVLKTGLSESYADVSELAEGIYMLHFYRNQQLLHVTKIVKY